MKIPNVQAGLNKPVRWCENTCFSVVTLVLTRGIELFLQSNFYTGGETEQWRMAGQNLGGYRRCQQSLQQNQH